MTNAICISCGARKIAPYEKCCHCGLDPSKDDTLLVKSVYLSTGRYVSGDETEEEADQQKRYSKELDRFGQMLENGQPIEYDDEEMARLQKNLDLMRSISRPRVWGALFRFAIPGMIFVGAIWLVYILLRLLNVQ